MWIGLSRPPSMEDHLLSAVRIYIPFHIYRPRSGDICAHDSDEPVPVIFSRINFQLIFIYPVLSTCCDHQYLYNRLNKCTAFVIFYSFYFNVLITEWQHKLLMKFFGPRRNKKGLQKLYNRKLRSIWWLNEGMWTWYVTWARRFVVRKHQRVETWV